MNKAIGLIEVKGYGTAITVADTMLKVAAVDLIGVQRAKGYGWMTVEITGDVGAVKAAVDAGKAKANEVDSLISALVIPRPANDLDKVVIDSVDYPAPKAQVAILSETNNLKPKNTEESKDPSPQDDLKKPPRSTEVELGYEAEATEKKDVKKNNNSETLKAESKTEIKKK